MRRPASLLGGPTTKPPAVRTTPRSTRMTPRLASMSMSTSRRRSAVSSPKRNAHQDASRIIAWYRSGIASVSFASSGNVRGRMEMARLVVPAPLMWAGLAAIRPSLTAVARMVRSRP